MKSSREKAAAAAIRISSTVWRTNVFTDQLTGKEYTGDTYSMQAAKELKTWDGQWLPVPFLRTLEQCWPDGGKCFECGPSNWARARVMPSSKDPNMLRVVIIFDTTVEERPAGEDRYHALSPQDVSAHGHFMLAHHVRDNSWFLNEAWVDQWLLELYTARNQGKRRGAAWGEEDPYVLKHLASYLTWLDIVRLAVKDVAVQVINPARDTPVDVDLILDIGNSRTTGILVETPPQCSTDLNQSYVLRLRDLSQPDLEYADPFETRVEFVDATFGNDTLSRRSGRQTPAFAWPSAVRIGPEAARLATQAVCAEGTTRMSSPKRYLWDERPWQQTWRYNTSGNTEPMVNRGLFARQLNPQGTPLSCFDDPLFRRSPSLKKQQPEPVFESLFTRSSLMMFSSPSIRPPPVPGDGCPTCPGVCAASSSPCPRPCPWRKNASSGAGCSGPSRSSGKASAGRSGMCRRSSRTGSGPGITAPARWCAVTGTRPAAPSWCCSTTSLPSNSTGTPTTCSA